MRRPFLPFAIVLMMLAAACSNSTAPETFSIAGTWRSASFPDAEFSITIVETARAIAGAGYRTSGEEATAFRVSGANTGRTASLLLDFDDREDINFEGEFVRENRTTSLRGALYGGGYAGEQINFLREEDDD